MRNTLLAKVLDTLSNTEREDWLRYVYSDCYCTSAILRQLAAHLRQAAFNWEEPATGKEHTWKQLFPGRSYREASLNNYISDLLQLTYDFLGQQQYLKQQDLQYELKIEQLLDRNLLKPAQRLYRKWVQQSSQARGAEAFRVRQIQAQYADVINLMDSKRQHSTAIQDQSRYLDQYYALQQLILYCGMLSRQSIVQGTYELPYLEEILKRYQNNQQGLQEEPAIGIYVALAQLLQEDSTIEDFRALQDRLQQYPDALPEEERKTAYNFLLNYCIRQINRGQTHFYQSVFDIYQELLAARLLLHDGHLTQWTYTNIITTASRLKAWEWTENFIHTYRDQLPAKDRYNAYHYNICALRYEMGQYDEALRGLHNIEFTDAFYQLAAKTIQLKIYYLQQEHEAFSALVFASRQFVLRNRQLSTAKKQAYQNFLKLIRRLFDLRHQRPYWPAEKWEQRRTQLLERLDNAKYSANNKDWIRGEVALLSQSK
ncbi:MAG: hypothetical protein AAFP77_07415 [Bacteroidota bacterium]